MKICMVGIGSIGSRHLKNMYDILPERGQSLQADALRSRKNPLPSGTVGLIQNEYYSFDDLPNDYDVAFITNPTNLHYDTIKRLSTKTRHMFIEKPVFDSTSYEMDALHLRKDSVYYIACPLRYTSVIEYLKEFITENKVYSARAICSSYLPDWRPGSDYRQCYSAKFELGGGVRTDLIHEWDYLSYLFGYPNKVRCEYGTYSHLEITSEDIAIYAASYSDKLVSLHLDYLGRVTRREIELYTESDVVVGDLANQCVRFLREGKRLDLAQERDEYQKKELRYFFDILDGKVPNHNGIEAAVKTLKIALWENKE